MEALGPRGKAVLLNIICLAIGTMMFYRGILDGTQYPGNLRRTLLGPVFAGGVLGVFLMYRRYRIGFWIFSALNFFLGFWMIFVLEDVWQHHILPHIVFSAVFIPFYRDMKSIRGSSRDSAVLSDRART